MPVGPGLRNLLLYAASALVMVWLGQAAYAWAPSFLYTVTCMVFGYSAGTAHFYRWAVLLDQSASRTQLTVAGLLFIAAAGAYVAVRHR
jgi:hypothetical protein